MKSELRAFLENVEPIPDRVASLVDNAMNTFAWRIAVFSHGDEYEPWLSDFYCHLQCTVLGIPPRAASMRFDLSRAWALLRRPYGENAPQALFDIARSGSEGGLRQIMRTMADAYGEEHARGLIGTAVHFYLAGRCPSAVLSDALEYTRLYPGIIPAEMTEGAPVRIMANFRKVLEMHPFVLQRVRQAVR